MRWPVYCRATPDNLSHSYGQFSQLRQLTQLWMVRGVGVPGQNPRMGRAKTPHRKTRVQPSNQTQDLLAVRRQRSPCTAMQTMFNLKKVYWFIGLDIPIKSQLRLTLLLTNCSNCSNIPFRYLKGNPETHFVWSNPDISSSSTVSSVSTDASKCCKIYKEIKNELAETNLV